MAIKKPKAPDPAPVPVATSSTFHIEALITAPGVEKTITGDLTVTAATPEPAEAPAILTEPQSTTIAPGETAELAVAATGTLPLGYQWDAAGAPIPEATAPTLTTPALQASTEYGVRVSNAVGAVDSARALVTVSAPITPPEPPAGLGLTYVRAIGLPSLSMGYATGDCTGRIVDGKVRLLFTGDEVQLHSPVYEVEITDQPVAAYVQTWADPYNGKRGCWVTGAQLLETAAALETFAHERRRPDLLAAARWYRLLGKKTPRDTYTWIDFATAATPALNGGHYYHADLDLLFVTFADSYNVAGRPDQNVVAIRLRPDGTADTWGPWRLSGQSQDGTMRIGPRGLMMLRPHPVTGLIMGAAALTSGNAGCPWGANLLSGAPWPTPARPAGPTVPDVYAPDCLLYGYYLGPEIDPVSGICSGPVRSMRRGVDTYVYESFPESGTQSNFVNPAAYQGIGSWTDNDVLAGIFPLEDRCYFLGGVAGSPIQNVQDPNAAHVFYATEINHHTCTHGFRGVPDGITGPVCSARFPFACVYPMSVLEQVKRGEIPDYQPDPSAFSNLEKDFSIVTAPIDSVGNAKMISGGFFDARTRDLYCISHGADRGTVTWGLINSVIHQWKVA